MSTDPGSETAKAVQEVAKASGKAVEAGQSFGRFIARFVAGSLEQGMGIFEDRLRYMRWERQVRLMQRAEQLMKEIGLEKPSRAIPLKLAVPLLEAASLEDDDHLQDMWARLLVNAANSGSKVSLQRAYISILEQITAFEAHILQKIYALPYEKTQHNGVVVGNLPDSVEAGVENRTSDDHLPEPREDVTLALANLARLGCVAIQKSMGGGELFKEINPTLLGKTFVEACTLRPNEQI